MELGGGGSTPGMGVSPIAYSPQASKPSMGPSVCEQAPTRSFPRMTEMDYLGSWDSVDRALFSPFSFGP